MEEKVAPKLERVQEVDISMAPFILQLSTYTPIVARHVIVRITYIDLSARANRY